MPHVEDAFAARATLAGSFEVGVEHVAARTAAVVRPLSAELVDLPDRIVQITEQGRQQSTKSALW